MNAISRATKSGLAQESWAQVGERKTIHFIISQQISISFFLFYLTDSIKI
jgi:hypothetical protein